jgi:thiol-disulfide isomerase/thioredoxin
MDITEALKALDRSKGVILKGMVALVAVIAVALMLACNGGASTAESEQSTVSEPDGTTVTAESGGLEADFSFTLYQGEDVLGASVVQLSDLLHKPIVLNFWAGLCPPCREEMPHFQEFYDEFEERINFVGVDVGQFTGLGNPEDAQELLDDLDVTYPAGYTEDSDAVKEYVSGMPTTVFITPAGEVFRSWTGYLSKDKLTEITEEMLAAEVTA